MPYLEPSATEWSPSTGWKLVPSAISDRELVQRGDFSNPLGDATIKGFLKDLFICLRKTWKYCAGVVQLTMCQLGFTIVSS
jgi:hypothetical protein